MSIVNKKECTYSQFVEEIMNVKEDTLFKIIGEFVPMKEEQIDILDVTEDRLDEYDNSSKDVYDEIILLLSSVPDKIQIELDLSDLCDADFLESSFFNLDCLKGIILPKNISFILGFSFHQCENLEYIIIPEGTCKNIYTKAFFQCPKLKLLKIDANVLSVSSNAICECNADLKVEYFSLEKDINYYHLKLDEFDLEHFQIETERLYLRPISLKDYENAKSNFTDPRVLAYEEVNEDSKDPLFDVLEKSEKYWKKLDSYKFHFAVFLKENDRYVGHMPLYIECDDEIEALVEQTGYAIGWGIAFDYQGNGYATEAAKAVIQWAKEFLKADRFWAYAHKQNLASIQVMKKLGMNFVEEFKDEKGTAKVIYALE